ncbi:hypothetical protein [Bifidobacterium apis]|uniref:hypothetical protein n=1 Tax=Bifidobacterium apis TaxID=3081440 RepID=UPI0030DBF2EF
MINNDEWLVVIDRQEAFAHNEWSRWACSDGAYYQTDKNYTRLAKVYGDRVAYTRYIAPQPPKGVWVEYMNEWPEFQVPPDDPMYDLTPETAELAKGHLIASLSSFGKRGPELQAAIKGSQKIALCGVVHRCLCVADRLGCCRPRYRRLIGSRCLRRIHARKPRAGNRYDGPVHTPHHHHRHRFAVERSSNRLTFDILDMYVGWVLSSQAGKNPTARISTRRSRLLHIHKLRPYKLPHLNSRVAETEFSCSLTQNIFYSRVRNWCKKKQRLWIAIASVDVLDNAIRIYHFSKV